MGCRWYRGALMNIFTNPTRAVVFTVLTRLSLRALSFERTRGYCPQAVPAYEGMWPRLVINRKTMSIKKIVQFSALTVLLVAGSAAAQTAGSVNVTSSPVTSSVSSGTGVNLGTVTLSGVQGGGNVSSLPIAISASNGGQLGNLSNCQVYNNQGTSLTGNNIVNTVAGVNSFVLNTPLSVTPSTGAVVLSVRCDVASNVVNGSVFTINAGVPNFGPVFRVNLDTAPSVPAGSQNVTIANISLGSTGASYNVSSIPLTITSSSNGSVSNLSNCAIRDASNLTGTLTNVGVIVNGSATTFNLAVPMMIAAGTSQMFALTCSLQPATAVGSTFTTSINPASVAVTNAATGVAVTPVGVPAGGTGPNGLPASTSGVTVVTAVGTAPVPPASGDTTPGVPNTGLGGNIVLLAELMLAGLIALFGAFYLGRKQA